MEITRRNFLKLGAIVGLGSALPGCVKETVLKPKEEPLPARGDEKFVSAFCGMCPAGCGIRVRKIGRHAVGVSGLPDHPINKGGLCPKGAASLQELYHPDRLRQPLLSQGGRGRGNWVPITWEEAFSLAAKKIRRAQSEKKLPLAILSRESEGMDQGLLRELAISLGQDNFFVSSFPMNELPVDAYENMQGASGVFWDLTKAKLIVSLGFDWLQSHPSHTQAQRVFGQLRGHQPRAHIVQIESRFSVSAAKADEWIPIRPGTEGVLALVLAREIIARGIFDENFVSQHTLGFEKLRRALEPFSIEKTAELTGIPQESIRLLILKFLSLRPSAVMTNRGPILTQMAAHTLNVLLGNIGSDKPFVCHIPTDLYHPHPALSPEGRGKKLIEGPLPEVLLVDRANPLFTEPDQWKDIFNKIPFIVAVSSQMTETAAAADLIVPCHTPLEAKHLSFPKTMEGKTIMNAAIGAVEPLYDTKDPGEIFLTLKQRILRDASGGADFDSYFKARVKERGGLSLLDEDSGQSWLEVEQRPQTNLISALPSGKINLETLVPLINKFNLTQERGLDKDFPLELYLFTPLVFSRGEGAHLPYLMSLAGPQTEDMWATWAEIHPETARVNGVSNGDIIEISSAKGALRAKARVLASAMPGVISVPVGLGHTAYGRWAKGVGANPLEIAQNFWSTPARIKRI